MRKISLPLTLLAVSLGLSACGTLHRSTDSNARILQPADTFLKVSQDEIKSFSQDDPTRSPGEFSEETIFSLLSAEIAGQRNQFDVALQQYVEQARQTRDIGIVVRAVRISQYLKSEKELLEMAELWSELDPTAAEPHHLASLALIRNRDYERALGHMEQLINLEGGTNFDNLAVHAKNLSEEDRKELLKLYESVLARHPDNMEVLFGYAILQEVNALHTEALTTADKLLKQFPEHQPAILMRARMLREVQGLEDSVAYLKQMTRKYPENRQLGTLYARMLIDNKDLKKAQEEFRILMERFPDTPGLKLSHALVAIENQQTNLARKELLELLEDGQHPNEAHFYLARIADQQEKTEEAIKHYQKVERGPHYFTALARSAYLMTKAGQMQEALQSFDRARADFPTEAEQIWQLEINLLFELKELDAALNVVNAALEERPDDPQLLYTRASIYDKQGNVAGMEQDLRKILALDPDNAIALNALGYILADKTQRYQEALALIEQALELKPDNPAIMDSMGWVQYRLGNLEESLQWLRKAYEKFPDPEVASHLGEVLWVSGQQDNAMTIWLESLSQHPNSPQITDTMRRLGAQPGE